jgi:SAM-dependent methyltransferase
MSDHERAFSSPIEHRIYPECQAGLYSHKDCTVAFYSRIRSLIDESTVLLNVGAGRGANIVNDLSPYRRDLQIFKGHVGKAIGIDIDDAVHKNPDLDEAYTVTGMQPWPISDGSIDVIVCDHVLEHVDDPEAFAREVSRVLKAGGWFCARTPTKWGYIGLATRSIPNSLHVRLLRLLQPHRKPEDVFPTRYKMNDRRSLRRHFQRSEWDHCSYGYNGVPGYHANSRVLFRIIELWCWLMPPPLSAKFHVFLKKRT